MALPWVRLDSSFATHDKVVELVDQHGDRGRAAGFVYCCSLGWCGLHGTDGLIRFSALKFIHGRQRDAQLLVEAGLWVPDPEGWRVRNYGVRQQLSGTTAAKSAAASTAARKAACTRWHGAGCGCWERDQEQPA